MPLLFIFESLGTAELILIGIVALIFLGPRKLPEIARKIGKITANFRNTTSEFKSTWEREVNFEEEERAMRTGELSEAKPEPVARVNSILNTEPEESIAAPTVKEIDKESFDNLVNEKPEEAAEEKQESDMLSDKRSWL